jgi:hypothetical protein
VDVAVKRETKYLCSARLTSRHTLWQHQRKQRRINAQQQPSQQAQAQNGSHADNVQLAAMAKFSEASETVREATSSITEEGPSLAESFLLGKITSDLIYFR